MCRPTLWATLFWLRYIGQLTHKVCVEAAPTAAVALLVALLQILYKFFFIINTMVVNERIVKKSERKKL